MRKPETLYHYCRTETFFSIIRNKEIWLSSLGQSNDYLEGKMVSKLAADIAGSLNMTLKGAEGMRRLVENAEVGTGGIGICLSTAGDVLSQWRGYAADGTGLAIGFNTEYLEWRRKQPDVCHDDGVFPNGNLQLERVLYDPHEHEELIKSKIGPLLDVPDDEWMLGAGPRRLIELHQVGALQKQVSVRDGLMDILFRLKGAAFREEQEWRLYGHFIHWWKSEQLNFRPASNQLIPYKALKLIDYGDHPIIDSIYLGPKHRTPDAVLVSFLEAQGFYKVAICRSDATYQ